MKVDLDNIMNKQEPLPQVKNDSDVVYDIETSPGDEEHKIRDSHAGYVTMNCPITDRLYLHMISCPNKSALICRGCGKKIW